MFFVDYTGNLLDEDVRRITNNVIEGTGEFKLLGNYKVLKQMVGESMNFLLIGMPGCGKTTFGKNAARRLGLEFVDVDREIAVSYTHLDVYKRQIYV